MAHLYRKKKRIHFAAEQIEITQSLSFCAQNLFIIYFPFLFFFSKGKRCQQRISNMSHIFKLSITAYSQRCLSYQPHLGHILVTSSTLIWYVSIEFQHRSFFLSSIIQFVFWFRRRKEDRVPEQDDVPKKPISDFGSKSLNEYLLGSRKMKPFPVAMSLVARYFYLFFVFLFLCVSFSINRILFVALFVNSTATYRASQFWEHRAKFTAMEHSIGLSSSQLYLWALLLA